MEIQHDLDDVVEVKMTRRQARATVRLLQMESARLEELRKDTDPSDLDKLAHIELGRFDVDGASDAVYFEADLGRDED